MTAPAHDQSLHHADHRRGQTDAAGPAETTSTRPRWLLPGLAVGFVVAVLVVAGVLSLSTVLYLGAFGGMMLMHLGGHGMHGGRGGAGGHRGHGGGATEERAVDPDRAGESDEAARLDERGRRPRGRRPRGRRPHGHDQPGSHGCH